MNRRLPAVMLALVLPAVVLGGTSVADADPPDEVDQTQLVPTTLDSSFAPFTCRLRRTGPVCTGERHVHTDWGPFDFSCGDVPLHARTDSDRYTTRYYDNDFLNYDRHFRSQDTDYLSTSPSGPATGTITGNVRFDEPFAVPGDDRTFTVVTQGVPWDIRPVGGPAVFRAVGTLVEPPGEVGTFTGHTTADGVTTRYVDAPLDEVLPDDDFVEYVCRAVTGG